VVFTLKARSAAVGLVRVRVSSACGGGPGESGKVSEDLEKHGCGLSTGIDAMCRGGAVRGGARGCEAVRGEVRMRWGGEALCVRAV